MTASRALRRWLVFVASLRLLSVYLGVFHPTKLWTSLFILPPTPESELYGRTFATWTMLTCALCIICSRNPENQAIYGATLISFVAAFAHFFLEMVLFHTMTLKTAYVPLTIAAFSSLWMAAGWNYYTRNGEKQKKEE